jgi:hypothetical protein
MNKKMLFRTMKRLLLYLYSDYISVHALRHFQALLILW